MAIRTMGPRRMMSRRAMLGAMGVAALALAGCKRRKSAQAWAEEGAAYAVQKRHAEALRCFDEALKLKPDFVDVLLEKGNILVIEKRFPEALASYDEGLKYDKKNAALWFNRAVVLIQMGKLDDAFTSVNKFLELKPEDEDAQALKCAILLKKGDPVEFVRQCLHERAVQEGLVKRDPGDEAMFRTLRMLQESQRVHNEARRKLEAEYRDAGRPVPY